MLTLPSTTVSASTETALHSYAKCINADYLQRFYENYSPRDIMQVRRHSLPLGSANEKIKNECFGQKTKHSPNRFVSQKIQQRPTAFH